MGFHHPELGTGPVSFEDSISPAFYELEREAIFERAWLNVGRVEQLPRNGSYFTKQLPGLRASLIVSRDMDGRVRAFHNVCRHRGNKLVWEGTPHGETRGNARQFVCKYHGWRYGLDGACTYVHQENEFFDLRKDELGLAPVHCDTWAGFIFVNLAREPQPDAARLPGTDGRSARRLSVPRDDRALLVPRRERQQLEDLQRRLPGVLPRAAAAHAPARPDARGAEPRVRVRGRALPDRRAAPHGDHERHPQAQLARRSISIPTEALTRSGSTGPWDAPDLGGKLPGVNPSGISRWGIDNFQVFPNLEILIYERGWFVTYRYWPTSHNTHVFEGDLHFVPARNARERLAHEYAALTFKEYGLQDCGTLDGTQMGLEQGAFRDVPAQRPGDPGAPLPQDRRRLGRRLRARAGGGATR